LSLVRMGAAMGLRVPSDFGALNQLTLLMQPAHLSAMAGRALEAWERDAERAAYVRRHLD
jgi:protein arginine kinase